MTKLNLILASTLLALGIACAGYFVSETLYKSKIALNTVEVKGLAERRVESDRAYWSIDYTVSGTNKSEISSFYKASESDKNKIIALLIKCGFSQQEITPGVINYQKRELRDNAKRLVEEKHILEGSIEIETEKVRLVSQARSKLNQLIEQGIDIQNNAPSYYFTKLNEIKPSMLKEAAQNARLAAAEFAANAGVQVGGIRDARQGAFGVCDVGENYGDTKKIEKIVRVVTTVTFILDE